MSVDLDFSGNILCEVTKLVADFALEFSSWTLKSLHMHCVTTPVALIGVGIQSLGIKGFLQCGNFQGLVVLWFPAGC